VSEWSDKFAEEIEELRRVRDELRVQMHLARQEAKERWEHLEKRWQSLEARLKVVREGSRESLGDIGEAGKALVEEIKHGYRHVRSLL
jgi:serine phosphatase RsbU (regulator of sigma subunit)